MKRLHLFTLLAVLTLLLCCILPTKAEAATIEASGSCGANVTYTLDSNGLLTISGTGATYDRDAMWTGWTFNSNIKTIVVKSGVTYIGDRFFYNCWNVTSVSLPATVTAFGEMAFACCWSLKTVNIPSGVMTIGDRVFYDCQALTTISLPSSVTSIGANAFSCTALTSFTVGANMTSIDSTAFSGCTSLTKFTVNSSNTAYSADSSGVLFNKSKSTLVKAPCKLAGSYAIPSTVTVVGDSAFSSCTKLTTITIPSSVRTIGDSAFMGNYITTIVIPEGVTSIGANAFYSCSYLTAVAVPASVTYIGKAAFCYCQSLVSVTIAGPVTSIGASTFSGCFQLSSVVLPDTVTSIDEMAFYSCSNLTSFNIPAKVSAIGYRAFAYCGGLQKVYLPDGLASIGGRAFDGCSKLIHVVLPKTLTSVESYAFNSCGQLTQVCYTGTEAQRSTISFSSGNTYLTNAEWFYNAIDSVVESHETCTAVQHICSYCKRTVWTETKETPTHSWTEATCTTAKTCTSCGTTVGKALGHSGDLWFDIIAPTCTAEGMKARICSVCSETETQPVAALGHSYNSVVTAPACTEQGYTTKTCTACGDTTVTDYVNATGHSLDSVVTAPTCTEKGFTTNTCSVCGDVTVTDYVDATGHNFGIWTQTKAPTCIEAGQEARTCVCGETETQPVAALGHSYSTVVTAPTCTEQGYTTNTCSVCGDVTVTDYMDATGHSFGAWEQTTAPDCVNEGEEKRSCACGEIETQIVPAKGHSWSAWIQTAAPTCSAEGSRLRFCNCGTRETETLAKLPHSFENEVCTVCGESEYFRLTLTEDTTVTLELERDVYIQMSGYDLTGTIITNGYKVYGMDSTTDGYSCENIGSFTCVDENGDFIVPERIYTEGEKQYMAICTEDRYSFHRFFVGVTHMSLEPEVVGLGYKSAIFGDEMVFAQLAATKAFSFRVQLEGYNPVYRHFDSNELASGDPITLRIRNYDVENYSEHNLYAQVSLTLNDGTVIETEQVALTFRWLTEQVNANYTDYTSDQLASFRAMLQQFTIVKKWDISNLLPA